MSRERRNHCTIHWAVGLVLSSNLETYMSEITWKSYREECNAIAEESLREAYENGSGEDDVYDRVHENVDGHEWSIYNRFHTQILQQSDNDNAYFKDFGNLEADSASDAIAKMAWAALRRDVNECVSSRQDVMQKTYKLFIHDIVFEGWEVREAAGNADALPTEYECTITGEPEEDEAVQVALQQLSDEVGLAIEDYDHDVQSLAVTFPD